MTRGTHSQIPLNIARALCACAFIVGAPTAPVFAEASLVSSSLVNVALPGAQKFSGELSALVAEGGGRYEPPSDHIDPIEREALLDGARAIRAQLGLDRPGSAAPRASFSSASFDSASAANSGVSLSALPANSTRLVWPVRNGVDNRADFQAEVSNYVDLDSASNSLLDYACGQRTYDRSNGYNHDGIDISSWPYPWTTMDSNGLDVIAAAPGTIVSKVDGQADKSCTTNTTANWNVIVLAHADGKQTVYGHLKRNSLTSKSVGDTVVGGEYLGQVGSSGVSTGPHLHFELLDAQGATLDPFAGACGADDSHWRWQPEYNRPRINAVHTGSSAPVIGDCYGSEAANTEDEFVAGDVVYVSGYFVNQRQNQAAQLEVLQPNGSVWLSVPLGTPAEDYAFSYWYRSFVAPDLPGKWRARITLNGETSESGFVIGQAASAGAVVAAVLPGSRSVGLNQAASVFATMANAGTVDLQGCRVLPLGPFSGQLDFQATDPATNAVSGGLNEPVSIPSGGFRSFVVSLNPTTAVAPTNVAFNFKCNNAPRARTVRGLNTLQFSAASAAPADILPVSATPDGDGVVRLSSPSGSSAFATAAINIGTGVSDVRVVPQATGLNLALNVCETDAQGACVMPPGPSSTVDFGGSSRTFSVFVSGLGDSIGFDPENNRVELVFEHSGEVRGVTSVAVTTD